jgi:hypothetical protein
MTNPIYSTFSNPEMAEKAAGALLDYGIRAEDISVVFPHGYVKREDQAEKGITTTTSGDAASGAAKGAGIGLAAGVLAALASVFVPGVGLIVGGGALAIAIGAAAGTTAAGAVAGGVTGYLKDQGVPDDQIVEYTGALNDGGALMSITPTDEKVDQATIESIIRKYDGNLRSYGVTERTLADTSNRSAKLL